MTSISAPIVTSLVLLTLLIKCHNTGASAVTKFKNLQCKSFDENVIAFTECKLNVIGRGIVSANIYAKLLTQPLRKLVINMALYQKANGYKPFMYNITLDYCKFANKSQRNILFTIGANLIKEYTNLNHSCPINHDLQIKNLLLSEDKFRLLPLPSGEYMLHVLYSTAEKWQASIKYYVVRNE